MAFNSAQNLLLGVAIGDSFGAGYEFCYKTKAEFETINLESYKTHPNEKFKHVAGRYTDDTQMSISELLLEDELVVCSDLKLRLANKFVDCYKRDPAIGYAQRFNSLLDSINTGQDLLDKIINNSDRNGAAMRSVPIGLIPEADNLVQFAKLNASITHDTPRGIASSVTIALLSHYNYYERRLPKVDEIYSILHNIDSTTADNLRLVERLTPTSSNLPELLFGDEWKLRGVPSEGMRTVLSVYYLLNNFSSPSDVLINAVRLGGDTDSVASISLGINLMNNSIEDLPAFLFNDLTNGKYGRDFLVSLGQKLSKRFLK
jgi:ADP-ribosylglycohydrolase